MFNQQVRTKNLVLVSLIAMFLSPLSAFAQNRKCPNRDCVFPLRAQGLEEPLRGLASQNRDARLQRAVEYKDNSTRIYNDAGQLVQCWNCEQQGENGQRAKRWDVKVIGSKKDQNDQFVLDQNGNYIPDDDRLKSPARTFTPAEKDTFTTIAKLSCRRRNGGLYEGTTFLMDKRVMVTSAHLFRDPDTNEKIDPAGCTVIFNAGNGKAVVQNIVSVRSRWDKQGYNYDVSNDLAFIVLDKNPGTTRELPAWNKNQPFPSRVSVAGLNSDVGDMEAITRTYSHQDANGRENAQVAPANNVEILAAQRGDIPTIHNPENLIVADYDCNHGTSGSPVFNFAGQIIGVHSGITPEKLRGKIDPTNTFSPINNYNKFIRFDSRFEAELDAVVASLGN